MSPQSAVSAPVAVDLDVSARARVVRELRRMIQSGSFGEGDALPSQREISRKMNVARETVRRAVMDLTKEGFVEGTRSRSRRVARRHVAPPAGRLMSSTVAVLTSLTSPHKPIVGPVSRGWDVHIQNEVGRHLRDAGRHVMLLNPDSLCGEQLGQLLASRPAGVVLTYNIGDSAEGPRVVEACRAAGVPVIVNGDAPSLTDCDRVYSDHAAGACMLTRWLLERGRQRILPLWLFTQDWHWLRQRVVGYERAMTDAGFEAMTPVRTPDLPSSVDSATHFRDRVRAIAGFLIEPLAGPEPIDAVMVATDGHAYQVTAALRLLGRKPGQDVLLVGYDNVRALAPERQWESSGPAATIDKNNDAQAAELASLLLARATGKLPSEPQCRLVPPKLVELPADGDIENNFSDGSGHSTWSGRHTHSQAEEMIS